MSSNKVEIQKITIKQTIIVEDEAARVNLKNLLSDILKVDIVNIEMRFEDKTKEVENFKFKNGL